MMLFRTCNYLRIAFIICGLLCLSESFAQQRLLIFTKTSGYRHNSINNGLSAIQQMGNTDGFEVVSTENANDFNADYLSGFNAVVFLSTTGDVLNSTQQAAFEKYIQSGGGFIGVHAATDCEYDWPWYGRLVGAWFNGHPDIQLATLQVTDNTHPSTANLPLVWQKTDEWYNFGNFQSNVNVLLRVDENSYSGGTMGANHPIAWYHEFDGGRSWYTALGHTESTFSDPTFLSHLKGGLKFAMGSGTVNKPPVASAGANITITLPVNSVTLNGSGADSDGSVVSFKWTKESGPGSGGGNIQSPDKASTEINGLNEGTYIFRLTVTDDDGATATNDIQVKVNAALEPTNIAPKANAGGNKIITMPVNSVTLTGTGTDDDGSIVSYSWTKVSGPASGGGTIQTPGNASTNINALKEGTYVYRLTVTDDDGATATDDVEVKVNASLPPPNNAPRAHAGNDITITLPVNSVSVSGSGTDDDGTIVSYKWSKVSGPAAGGGVIQFPDKAVTGLNDLKAGNYVFRLTITDDDGAVSTDDMQVKVNAAPPSPNTAPKANAGADKTITLPTSSVNLAGSGTDSDGTIVSYSWTKISGPSSGGGTIQSPDNANTNISGLKEGIYIFRLTVTDDKGAAASDDVQVKVNAGVPAPNQAPVANAGADITLTLPDDAVTLNGSGSSDPDGTIQSWEWVKMDGPVAGILSGGNTSRLQLSKLEAGVYLFKLIVTDDEGVSASDEVTVTVFETNQLPVVKTKDTITIILPVQNTELDASGSYDPDGTIDSVKWVYVKGPRKPTMLTPDNLKSIVTDLIPGVYDFKVTITDNRGGNAISRLVVVVKNSTARRLIPTVGLYPNPAQKSVILTIDAEIDGRTQVTFYDLHGRPVLKTAYQKNTRIMQNRIEIAHLGKGMYMVEIIIERAEKVVRKLVKH